MKKITPEEQERLDKKVREAGTIFERLKMAEEVFELGWEPQFLPQTLQSSSEYWFNVCANAYITLKQKMAEEQKRKAA